jgi:zinc/manganese transport system ATP-binding protein
MPDSSPVLALDHAAVRYGTRTLWSGLTLEVGRGEFVAVLGPNGSGKTTLIKVVLGLAALTSGEVTVGGTSPRRGSHRIGYVPQQRAFDPNLAIRGRDLVQFGLDGHRAGLPRHSLRARQEVDAAIASVGATAYADAPIGLLSGGEQQRLRIAQALLGNPDVLLCDEPLLSLDLAHQRAVCDLIDRRRRDHATGVVFVTHDINPILAYVDRVLYLVGGRWAIGTPAEVLTSERLSDLYGTPVDVVRIRDRIIVIGSDGTPLAETDGHHHHDHPVAASPVPGSRLPGSRRR